MAINAVVTVYTNATETIPTSWSNMSNTTFGRNALHPLAGILIFSETSL